MSVVASFESNKSLIVLNLYNLLGLKKQSNFIIFPSGVILLWLVYINELSFALK
jgi:hypothetical protein